MYNKKGMRKSLKNFQLLIKKHLEGELITTLVIFIISLLVLGILIGLLYNQKNLLSHSLSFSQNNTHSTQEELTKTKKQLEVLQHEDQYVKNKQLEEKIKNIQDTYTSLEKTYQNLADFESENKKNETFDTLFAQSLHFLSQTNYASAQASLTDLNTQIDKETQKLAPKAPSSASTNAPANNTPPSSGFSFQSVTTDNGTFTVDIIAADMASTRVIVDTAADSDCSNNCPVMSLASFVARNGAYAGINGSFFCPATYPSCAGKTNSFDLLVMNKDKYYFNSDNNVYSTNPAVIFGNGFVRFVSHASEWGRDTSVDGVLSNYPLLISGGNIVYSGSNDPKFGSKGPRGFVANKGNTVYIGFVNNANMSDSARVLKTMGMDNAMNLDEGGSTALWSGGYKLGPGRDLANAILFVRK
jgi:hypothetical protein